MKYGPGNDGIQIGDFYDHFKRQRLGQNYSDAAPNEPDNDNEEAAIVLGMGDGVTGSIIDAAKKMLDNSRKRSAGLESIQQAVNEQLPDIKLASEAIHVKANEVFGNGTTFLAAFLALANCQANMLASLAADPDASTEMGEALCRYTMGLFNMALSIKPGETCGNPDCEGHGPDKAT